MAAVDTAAQTNGGEQTDMKHWRTFYSLLGHLVEQTLL